MTGNWWEDPNQDTEAEREAAWQAAGSIDYNAVAAGQGGGGGGGNSRALSIGDPVGIGGTNTPPGTDAQAEFQRVMANYWAALGGVPGAGNQLNPTPYQAPSQPADNSGADPSRRDSRDPRLAAAMIAAARAANPVWEGGNLPSTPARSGTIKGQVVNLNDPDQRYWAWVADGAKDYRALARAGVPGYQEANGGFTAPGGRTGAGGVTGTGGASGNAPATPDLNSILEPLMRRQAYLGFTPAANKPRADRVLATLFSGVPAIQQLAIEQGIDPNDWREAVRRWAGNQGLADDAAIEKYAVDQGLMPKAPARTVQDLVEARTLDILKSQGLISPEMESRVNAQLEDIYQADVAGTEPPESTTAEDASLMLPTPSMQFWAQTLNPGEQASLIELFETMGITPEQLAADIRSKAPPGGGSPTAQQMFRRM